MSLNIASSVRRTLHACTNIDYFKCEGRVKSTLGPQQSITGLFGTFLMISIMLAYSVNAAVIWWNTPYSVSILYLPTSPQQEIDLMPTCISTPFLNNPEYYAYNFELISFDENNTKTTTPIQIDHQSSQNKMCLSKNATKSARLKSFCTLAGNCAFVRFNLWLCSTPDPKKPNQTKPGQSCKDYDTLRTQLERYYVDVTYDTPLGDVIVHTAPKVNASMLYNSVFVYNESAIHPDMLRRFVSQQFTTLIHSTDTYQLQYFFAEKAPTKQILEIRMQLDATWVQVTETHRTSLDLVSQISAFFGVVSGALAIIFLSYNDKKFYELHPAWCRIDPDFEVVPEGAEFEQDFYFGKKISNDGNNNNNNDDTGGGGGDEAVRKRRSTASLRSSSYAATAASDNRNSSSNANTSNSKQQHVMWNSNSKSTRELSAVARESYHLMVNT